MARAASRVHKVKSKRPFINSAFNLTLAIRPIHSLEKTSGAVDEYHHNVQVRAIGGSNGTINIASNSHTLDDIVIWTKFVVS